jgi:hypothetical protein
MPQAVSADPHHGSEISGQCLGVIMVAMGVRAPPGPSLIDTAATPARGNSWSAVPWSVSRADDRKKVRLRSAAPVRPILLMTSPTPLARSTAKPSPAVYSLSSPPPLDPACLRPPHFRPMYPLHLKASSRTHIVHSGMLGLLLRCAGVRDVTGTARPDAARQRW